MPDNNSKQDAMASHYVSKAIGVPLNDYWAARRALAEKLKALQLQLQTTQTSIDDLNSISEAIDLQLQSIADKPRLFGRDDWSASGDYGDWSTSQIESTPIIGPSNPISPGLSIWFEQDGSETKAYATVTFNWLYEGSANICHGGWVAAVFDEFLGTSQILAGKTGMTASLATSYHKPTPLNKELLMTARITSAEERKVIVMGEMYDGDTLTASCEGVFVLPTNNSSGAFGNISQHR